MKLRSQSFVGAEFGWQHAIEVREMPFDSRSNRQKALTPDAARKK